MIDELNPFYLADRTSTRGRNTSDLKNQNCTVWYGHEGQVRGVGPQVPERGKGLKAILLKCDEIGVLPEVYGKLDSTIGSPLIGSVLNQAREYRVYLEKRLEEKSFAE